MKSITFDLPAEALDQRLLESIKLFFKGQRIKIVVSENEADDAEASLQDVIANNRKSPYVHQIPAEAFSEMVDRFAKDEDFDLMGAMEEFKVART